MYQNMMTVNTGSVKAYSDEPSPKQSPSTPSVSPEDVCKLGFVYLFESVNPEDVKRIMLTEQGMAQYPHALARETSKNLAVVVFGVAKIVFKSILTGNRDATFGGLQMVTCEEVAGVVGMFHGDVYQELHSLTDMGVLHQISVHSEREQVGVELFFFPHQHAIFPDEKWFAQLKAEARVEGKPY
ncbi:hypothetical protein [Spirosoma sordidisoli]|uniref:Uncharacterized protein n=1 Tax=Spirosoma sordidisoli TaxID=2502893 RepID=A0A4Q2UK68_9BACT|nr:hypothetical protein [Spirosoma sordidisoli]RYC69664.1 hypothetical protein EQG79_13770 [Spirosoma sordidisoli]